MVRMTAREKIASADLDSLRVIQYPDPRLKEICTPVEEFDDALRALVERMAAVMFESRGVGLAAPQVGVTVRLFLASPSFDPSDLHVYINPRIVETSGSDMGEEGCLSFPEIFCKVKRAQSVTVEAFGPDGEPFRHIVEELHARIIQHESDHLDGTLLVDRMGSLAKLSHRKALQALELDYASAT